MRKYTFDEIRDIFAQKLPQILNDQNKIDALSFHLAEIGTEINELNLHFTELLNEKDNKISKQHFDTVLSMLCIHWRYHIEELVKISDEDA